METEKGIVCTGFETIPGVSEEEMFLQTLLWAIDKCPKYKEGITEVNFKKKSFVMESHLPSPHRSQNPAFYHFLSDFKFVADKLSYTFFRIECEYPGMLNMPTTLAFERMRPDKKPKHKSYMEEYSQQAAGYIGELIEYIQTNTHQPVTHWTEIHAGKAVKGMNETECLLACGKPLDRMKSESGEDRWRYDSYTYLFFKDGILASVIE